MVNINQKRCYSSPFPFHLCPKIKMAHYPNLPNHPVIQSEQDVATDSIILQISYCRCLSQPLIWKLTACWVQHKVATQPCVSGFQHEVLLSAPWEEGQCDASNMLAREGSQFSVLRRLRAEEVHQVRVQLFLLLSMRIQGKRIVRGGTFFLKRLLEHQSVGISRQFYCFCYGLEFCASARPEKANILLVSQLCRSHVDFSLEKGQSFVGKQLR